MFLLHSWQQFLENSDLVRIKIIEEFRPRKPGDFGILLKNFKNSAAVCSSYKILTNEFDNCLFHFISLNLISLYF